MGPAKGQGMACLQEGQPRSPMEALLGGRGGEVTGGSLRMKPVGPLNQKKLVTAEPPPSQSGLPQTCTLGLQGLDSETEPLVTQGGRWGRQKAGTVLVRSFSQSYED